MPYVKNNNYRDMPFCVGTPKADFYAYWSLEELARRSEECKERLLNCRTIGILQSKEGRYFLNDVEHPAQGVTIRVSVVYVTSSLQSVVTPCPVQVFGSLHWKKQPVIFAKILQVLSVSSALRLHGAMQAVASVHRAQDLVDNAAEIIDLT